MNQESYIRIEKETLVEFFSAFCQNSESKCNCVQSVFTIKKCTAEKIEGNCVSFFD